MSSKKKVIKSHIAAKEVKKQPFSQPPFLFTSSRSQIVGITSVLLLGLLVYSNSFVASFQLDDYYTIVDNLKIRSLSHTSDWWHFAQNRPVSIFTFALNYHFFQLEVWSYHAVNLIIHLTNAILVWWLCLLIFSSPAMEDNRMNRFKYDIGIIAALLFVSHPLATASVTYIVQRMASLVSLFYLLSIAMYLKARLEQKLNISALLFYIAAAISAMLALKTKENAYTLPFAILLVETFFMRKSALKKGLGDFKSIGILVIGLAVLFIIPFLTTFSGIKPVMPSLGKTPVIVTPLNYLYTQFSVIVKYIQLLVLPVNQNVDYDWEMVDTLFSFHTLASLIFLISFLVLAVYLFKKQRLISFGIFWFFLTLAVESSIIPLADMIFEHRTYLPSVGFFLILTYTVFYFFAEKNKGLIFGIVGILLLTNSILTFERNKVWKDGVSLWTDAINKSPNVTRPLINRGFAYVRIEQWDKAIADYTRAIELDSVYNYEAYSKRGIAYGNIGEWWKAIADCSKAIELEPKLVKGYYNRAVAWASLGKAEMAVQDFNFVLGLDANFEKVNYQRGALLMNLGYYDRALIDFNKEFSIHKPTAEQIYNRGFVNEKLNKWDMAIEDYTTSINLDPDYVSAHYNRAIAYYKTGQKEKSIPDYNNAIRLSPKEKEMYYMRGLAFSDLGQTEKAINDYTKALELDPNFTIASNNRAALLKKSGKFK